MTLSILAVVTLAMGCGDSRFLTGRYCSHSVVDIPWEDASGLEAKYLALEIGHYGPDLGGMVGFHGQAHCRVAMSFADRCPCSDIVDGFYSNGKATIWFSFEYIAQEDCEESDQSLACLGEGRECEWGEPLLLVMVLTPSESGELLAGHLCPTEKCCNDSECKDRIPLEFEKTSTSEKDFEIAEEHRNFCQELYFGEVP